MDLDVERQIELGRAPQALAQNILLDLELVVVAGVLVVATATATKVWAGRLDAMGRWLDDSFHRRSRESRLLLGQGGIDFFSRQNKWDEDGLAASTVVGRQAAEAITAIDQLFDCEEQELILRHEEGQTGAPCEFAGIFYPAISTVSLKPTALVTAASVDKRGFPCFESAR